MFQTCYGHYEQEMNDMFRDQLKNFMVVFLDDILIYSRTLDDHSQRVRFVLQSLQEIQFYAKISKCEVFKKFINYLDHLITERGVEIDPSCIEEVKIWLAPYTIIKLRSFLGFVDLFPTKIYSQLLAIDHIIHKPSQGSNA